MNATKKIRIAKHIDIEWLEQQFVATTCPNCGTAGNVQQYLNIDFRPPKKRYRLFLNNNFRFILQICPHCTARFVDNMHVMNYGGKHLIKIGWDIYQAQIGAGIWPISAPLTRINEPAGAKVLEIGGAFGFGLDFCIIARGWQGQGYDPSPLAAFGAREMGLNISQDYFTSTKLSEGPWDVAISTEVIEHLERPPEFLSLMRRAVASDGILLLTTPDAEWITPELGADYLVSLLSPDAHLVLQTEKSLRVALANAGFKHVVVKRESMTLIAYASATPFTLNEDMAAGRMMYRRYLEARCRLSIPESDLRFGFAGRALFEAANDADAPAVEEAWAALLPGAKARFGIDLDTIRRLPEGTQGASIAELAKLIPLGLGMILYARAMHLLGTGRNRREVMPILRVAGDAIAALQNALGLRSLSDWLSVSIAPVIEREILLCQAEAGDPECLPGLAALDDEVMRWRGFVTLVNAGAYELARTLREQALPEAPSETLPGCTPALRQDALAALSFIDLQRSGEAARIRALTLSAFVMLVNGGAFAAARLLLTELRPLLATLRPPLDDAACNLLFTVGMLFLQRTDDLSEALAVLARLRVGLAERSAGEAPDPLFWPALRGEVVALHRMNRNAEAMALLRKSTATYRGAPDDLMQQMEHQSA